MELPSTDPTVVTGHVFKLGVEMVAVVELLPPTGVFVGRCYCHHVALPEHT